MTYWTQALLTITHFALVVEHVKQTSSDQEDHIVKKAFYSKNQQSLTLLSSKSANGDYGAMQLDMAVWVFSCVDIPCSALHSNMIHNTQGSFQMIHQWD